MSVLDEELQRRLRRPQRHRLLQGFPAVPAMTTATPTSTPPPQFWEPAVQRRLDGSVVDHAWRAAVAALAAPPFDFDVANGTPEHRANMVAASERQRQNRERQGRTVDEGNHGEPPYLTIDSTRGLIVGVIPHTQCIPRTEGCGFCTFPHDVANTRSRNEMVDTVTDELAALCASDGVVGRRVDAIYLGGGTANLSSSEQIGRLVATIGGELRIDEAELTLEGTPQLFAAWFGEHLKNLARQPVAQKRISMGIQTFDDGFLRRMGREKFGDASTVRKLIKRCRELSITTSGDFLFNLPGQTAAQMDHDVAMAVGLGLDQICLYNLVLYEGLGTPWSKDPALVAVMPDNDAACANWLRLRRLLLSAGYVQSTLTNFERADVAAGPGRFRYEVDSFSPEAFDGIGSGPMSISSVVDWPAQRAIKLLRRKNIRGPAWSGGDLMYRYERDDLRLLFVIRSLAKTAFSTTTYASLFGTRFADDFAAVVAVLGAADLIVLDDERCSLTPRGMFFSDAVVSMLAATRATVGDGVRTDDLLREHPQAGYLGMG